MKTSRNGLAFIEKEEGVILYSYDDYNDKRVSKGGVARGTLTIGVGHTSAAGDPKVIPGMVITKAQADKILAQDLNAVEKDISRLVKVPLNQNQFDALVSFQFNTGGLSKSSVLRKLNQKDYKGAANAMLNWSKGNGNPTLLLGRRQRERSLFLTPSKDNTTGPAIGTGVTAVWLTFTNFIHAHPYASILSAIALGLLIGSFVHFIRNRNAQSN